jgi:phage-related protein
MSNLLPDYTPTRPISKSVKPRQRTAKLPSWGIEQRDTTGQNQTSPEWSVRWILAPTEANTLDAFLSAQAKTGDWFLWTPPDAAQGRFRCDDWSKQLSSCNIYEVQATFRQVFGFARPLLSGAFVGSFTLTGRNTSFFRRYILRPVKSSFALSGNDAALVRIRRVLANTGSFALTGNDVALGQPPLPADTGTFVLTGNDAALARAQRLPADTGTFVLTGNDAAQAQQQQLVAGTGTFVLTGAAVSFSYSGDSSAYWNRWQSLTDDPPLLFE